MSSRYTGVLPLDHTLPKADHAACAAPPIDVMEVLARAAGQARMVAGLADDPRARQLLMDLAAAHSEIYKLSADAARYRFLRDNNGVANSHSVEVFIDGEAHAPGHLDAQVDEAMAGGH